MRHALAILLLLCLATPAYAAEVAVVEGDGYSMRLPLGFKSVDVSDVTTEGVLGRLARLVPVEGKPTVEVFFKGEQLAPQGVVVVTRGALRHDPKGTPLGNLEAQLAALKGELTHVKQFDIKHRAVNGYDGLEVLLRGRILPGDERPQELHHLVVCGGSWVMSIVMVHRVQQGNPALGDWSEMIGSLSLGAPREAVRRLVVWAGVSVAALFVLFLLLRVVRGGAFGRRVDFSREGESLLKGTSAFDSATTLSNSTRAMDGLPVFHGSGAPAPTPRRSSGPSAATTQTNLPGLRSTLREK